MITLCVSDPYTPPARNRAWVQIDDPSVRHEDGRAVLVEHTLEYTPLEDELEHGPRRTMRDVLREGDQIVLARSSPEGGRDRYWWTHDLDGIPGNSRPEIKRTSGWRGTTNGLCVDALGIWRVVRIEPGHRPEGSVRVVLRAEEARS